METHSEIVYYINEKRNTEICSKLSCKRKIHNCSIHGCNGECMHCNRHCVHFHINDLLKFPIESIIEDWIIRTHNWTKTLKIIKSKTLKKLQFIKIIDKYYYKKLDTLKKIEYNELLCI